MLGWSKLVSAHNSVTDELAAIRQNEATASERDRLEDARKLAGKVALWGGCIALPGVMLEATAATLGILDTLVMAENIDNVNTLEAGAALGGVAGIAFVLGERILAVSKVLMEPYLSLRNIKSGENGNPTS